MAEEKKKHGIKAFFSEFKTFITRGNVLDLAVGVIVGSAFTAIITAVTNNILQPLINWVLSLILGGESLSNVYTMLKPAYEVDATTGLATNVIDLANSIYIDWGAVITAIINFILVAFVLFCIVRFFNNLTEAREGLIAQTRSEEKKAIRAYRKQGLSKKEAIAKHEADLKKIAEEKAAAEAKAKAEAEAKAKAEEEKATANTRLLEEIRDLLKKNN